MVMRCKQKKDRQPSTRRDLGELEEVAGANVEAGRMGGIAEP